MNKKLLIGIALFVLVVASLFIFLPKDIETAEILKNEIEQSPTDKNLKIYDPIEKEVTVRNPDTLEDVSQLKLNSELNEKVGIGYQKVAEFQVTVNKDYVNAFEKIEFYDLKNSNREIERQFDYKYKSIRQVPNYISECGETKTPNGTIGYECKNVQDGFKDVEDWKDLSDFDFNTGETLTIGIFTETQEGDHVEWIPTMFGVRIQEWATWEASLNNEIISYYKLDEGASDGGTILDSLENGTNGTNNGAVNTSGIILSAYDFEKTESDNISFTSPRWAFTTQPFSINVWAKSESLSTNNVFVGTKTAGGYFFGINTNKLYFGEYGEVSCTDTNTGLGVGGFNMYTIVFNSSGKYFFINGTFSSVQTCTVTPSVQNYWFGQYADSAGDFDGVLDEIGIWNRTLTPTEISNLYNSGDGISYIPTTSPTEPEVTLNSPVNAYNSTNATIIFNVTATDQQKVDNVTLFIDGVSNETNSSGVNGTYLFTKTLIKGDHNWSVGVVNNQSEIINSSVNNFTIDWIFKVQESYTASILEGGSSNFIANFTTNGTTLTIANLSYNETQNLGTITPVNSSFYKVSKTLIAPSVSANTNLTFYWNTTLSTNYKKSFSTNNQTVLNFNVDNCSVNTNVLYNFTIQDEELLTNLSGNDDNTTGKVDLQIYDSSGSSQFTNFSNLYTSENSFAVCLSSDLSSGESYLIDTQVQYGANNYETEFYNIQNEILKNDDFPTNITLYDLNSSDSQVFTIIFKDSSFLSVPNALVEVQRKYVDEGIFRIVERPETDNLGKSLVHLVLNDVIYNFIITKNGVTLGTFTNVIAVCQNPTINTCTIDFNAFSSGIEVPDFESNEDFNFTLTYNETSKVITSAFVIPSGTASKVSLNVTTTDTLGTSVCSDVLTSTSGTLSCTVPNTFGNTTVKAELYKDNSIQSFGNVKLDQNPSDIYGVGLVMLGLFVMLTLIGAGISDNPVFTVIFFMVGVILLFSMNLVANNGFVGATATILWLVIAVIIVIIKGGRRN